MTTPSNLVPGSVWQRNTKRGASNSTVLFVTNEGAAEEVLAAHPQQVVFLTEAFKVLSMTPDAFVAKRTYVGLDSDIEALLGMVTSPPAEEEEDVDLDIENIEVDESLFPIEAATAEEAEAETSQDRASKLRLNVGPHPLAQALSQSLVSYSESPFHTGDTLHTMRFALKENGMSLSDIRSAFLVSDPNAIAKFEVSTATETFQVEIDCFVDVLLESTYQAGDLGCLYVTSAGDFRPAPEPTAPEDVRSFTHVQVGTPGTDGVSPGELNTIVQQVQTAAIPQVTVSVS